MSQQSSEINEQAARRHVGEASVYSSAIQESMRYNRLRSSEYPVVMTLMDAVLHGDSEEKWKAAQQRLLKTLEQQKPDEEASHTDAPNHYEQMVARLKDINLWPWLS